MFSNSLATFLSCLALVSIFGPLKTKYLLVDLDGDIENKENENITPSPCK